MNFQFYLEKLLKSKEFQRFKKENKNAFLCSGFFVIDKKGQENSQNLDYSIPSSKKMFSFKLNGKIELVPIENYGENVELEKISEKIDFDFDNIEDLILNKMEAEKIKNRVDKLLLSLQTRDKKNYILGTIFISGLGLLRAKIDLNEMKIIEFEKKSLFDMMKIVKKGD